jgi:hypothetical protein
VEESEICEETELRWKVASNISVVEINASDHSELGRGGDMGGGEWRWWQAENHMEKGVLSRKRYAVSLDSVPIPPPHPFFLYTNSLFYCLSF